MNSEKKCTTKENKSIDAFQACVLASSPCQQAKNVKQIKDQLLEMRLTPTGFSGSRCEVNINDCLSSPCLNNGTCLDQVDGYLCDCLSGFRQEAERIKNMEF
jgi:hypothetical protein